VSTRSNWRTKGALQLQAMHTTRKRKHLVYDVGMHTGEDTDYYLKKGLQVIGFEADPDLCRHCRNRFSGAIAKGELSIVEGAVTDLPGQANDGRTITFFRNRDKSVWGTVSREWARRNESMGTSHEKIQVPAIDFSRCLQTYGIPYYLKIDIEGRDTVCLQVLSRFAHKPDYVSIESEKVSFDKLRAELDLLETLGYSRFKAVQQQAIARQKEPNPSREGRYLGYRFNDGSSGLFGTDLPGEWQHPAAIRQTYQTIFARYKQFGDLSRFGRNWSGRALRAVLSALLRTPVPGWYDTHARHETAPP